MRFSTLLFLLIFGGFVWTGARRQAIRACASECWTRCESPCCGSVSRPSPRRDPRIGELESELRRTEQRSRDLERSLGAVRQSARALAEVTRRHPSDELRQELAEIEQGVARLERLREKADVDHVALEARLELARAGLLDEDVAKEPPPARKGPVDSLPTSPSLPHREF